MRCAENGRMTQRIFFDYSIHFVKNLPKGQGRDGEPVILFLDGHSSRWDVSSLVYLLQNNVCPFFLPSHTSIWSQPNENGVNLRWLKSIETAVSSLGMRFSAGGTTPQYFNIIIRHAWKMFIKNERDNLLTCKQNNTTNAYMKTGLYPVDPNCESWSNVLETMEPLNRRYKKGGKCEKVQSYEIIKRKDKTGLTEEEKKTLMKGLPSDTNFINAAYFHMRQALSIWRRELLFDPSAVPSPVTAPQIISTRIFSFSKTETVVADMKKSFMKRIKVDRNEKEEAGRQILDCTPITNSIPLVYSYLVPTPNGTSCEQVRINGHAVRNAKDSFVAYLKDERPTFTLTTEEILNTDKFILSPPDLVMSAAQKDLMNRRAIRESTRTEVLKVKARKEQAILARENWIEMEFKNMQENIKKDPYTLTDFKSLLHKIAAPFKHRSSDGYITECNNYEAVCINEMAMNAIDGTLQKRKQEEEISRIRALEKQRKMKKRKRTPNTMRADDGVGIVMRLQEHDKQTDLENSAARVEGLKKSLEKLEKTLQLYAKIEHRHKGIIDFEKCTGKELNTLMSFVFPNSGLLSKAVAIRKAKFREKGITSDNIKYLAQGEAKKLTKLKLELSNIEDQAGEHDGELDGQEDDEEDKYICAEI